MCRAIQADIGQHMSIFLCAVMQVYPNVGAVMHIKRGRMPGPTLLAAVLMLMATNALAQTTNDEVLQALKPTGMKSSLKQKIEIIAGQKVALRDENPNADVTIQFKFNSDRPTAVGQQQLKALGEALKDPDLRDLRFVLAGHADSRGGLEFNQLLSERRANAVKRYLTRVGIDPVRLFAAGFGKSRPLDTADPASGRNRRVQIINIAN